MIRILLADDQSSVRSALRLLLEQEPDCEIVAEADDIDQLLPHVHATRPDLVLLDWELPGSPSSDLLTHLRKIVPDVCILALSGHPEAEQAALSAGADGFVSKGEPPEALLEGIRRCSRRDGRRYTAPEFRRDESIPPC
ncbi:MAG TPA: response regulator transcription factor [Chloroflexi bacterium]|jgi:two-component system response regulator DesR|nr:response regulator transcription factor [Chloroflexota bacterium]